MRKSSLVLILAVMITAFVYAVPVKKIDVVGLKSLEKDFFITLLHMKIGDQFSTIKLRTDIQNLYELEYFDTIDAEIADFEDGVSLTYSIKERPHIIEVRFEGNKKFDDDELSLEIPFLTESAPFDKRYLTKAKYTIEKKYQEKGFAAVDIKPEFQETEDGVIVTISITEGRKVSIGTITFDGAQTVPLKKLKKAMETKESSFWRHPNLDREKLDEDMKKIEKKLWDLGYFGARVDGYDVALDNEKKYANVTVKIVEGKQYILQDVVFTGNTLFTNEQLSALVTTKKNEQFTGEEWDKTRAKIYEVYADKSYIFASVDPAYTFIDNKVVVNVSIIERKPVMIGRITVEGNTKTVDKIILRELAIKPGDEFRRELLMYTQQSVYNLGYFEAVDIIPTPDTEKDNVMHLTIKVKEQNTGTVNFGGSYSGVSGFAMFLEFGEKNLLGRGYAGTLKFQYGGKLQSYEFGITDPFFMDTPTYISFNIYRKVQDYTDYKIYRNGGSFTIGRKLGFFTSGYLTYLLEKVELTDIEDSASEFVDATRETRSSMSLTFSRDSRDNKMEPSSGTRHSFTAELGGTILGGDINYQKYEVTTNWFFKSIDKFVFSTYLKTGIVDAIDPTEKVPVYERFYVGGNYYGVRGYDDKELSPYDENGYIEGGSYYLTASLGYKYPVAERLLTAYLFWDVGYAWRDFGDFNFRDMRDGAGLGVKIMTPMGPITLDYGYGFAKGEWKFHFGISQGTF